MTTTIKVAGVGAGYFSRFHYGSWARIDRVRVVGVADPDLPRALATGHPAFGDLVSMVEATRPDLLDIIVPPAAQAWLSAAPSRCRSK